MRNNRAQNIIGSRVRSSRSKLGWTQAGLARKCQIIGFDINRTGICEIESLGLPITDLVPKGLPTWEGRKINEEEI